jgi:hypothetical protein
MRAPSLPQNFLVGASGGGRDQPFAWCGSGSEAAGISARINATTASTIRVRASGVSRPTSPVIKSLLAVNSFPRSGIAHHTQGAGRERRIVEHYGCGVAMRLAGDLTEHAIAASDVGEYNRRTELRPRQVREGKPDENYCTFCRCFHASSSSGQSQSSASAVSLRSAVSAG